MEDLIKMYHVVLGLYIHTVIIVHTSGRAISSHMSSFICSIYCKVNRLSAIVIVAFKG